MADQKITQYDDLPTPVGADLFVMVDDVAGTPVTKKATLTNVATAVNALASNPTQSFVIAASDETTALTTGAAKTTFRMPYAFTLTGIRASLTTAGTDAEVIVDVDLNGATIMTTDKLKFDTGEKTTTTYSGDDAALTTTALTDDGEITVNIDQIGSSVAGAGLKVTLIGAIT